MASQSNEFLAILSSSMPNPNNSKKTPSNILSSRPTAESKQQIDLHNTGYDPNLPYPVASPISNQTISTSDNYSLEGLVHVLRSSTSLSTNLNTSSPKDQRIIFSLGSDLSSLGLDLNSADFLYTKFGSPWIDTRGNVESILPTCYFTPQSASNLLTKVPFVSDETLFYIFYGMPRDKAQVQAALELHNRGWRYHRGLKLWFSKDPQSTVQSAFFTVTNQIELNVGSGGKGEGQEYVEKGMFVFFDFSTWQKITREFSIQASMVELQPPIPEKV